MAVKRGKRCYMMYQFQTHQTETDGMIPLAAILSLHVCLFDLFLLANDGAGKVSQALQIWPVFLLKLVRHSTNHTV